MTDDNLIIWFDQIGKDDVPTVGGKGANLGEMTRAEIPVPPGYVVSTAAYRQFIDATNLQSTLAEFLSDLDAKDTAKLSAVSAEVRRAIQTAAMPDEINQGHGSFPSQCRGGQPLGSEPINGCSRDRPVLNAGFGPRTQDMPRIFKPERRGDGPISQNQHPQRECLQALASDRDCLDAASPLLLSPIDAEPGPEPT